MSATPRYREPALGGCLSAEVERRADGTTVLRSTDALRWFPDRLTDCLEQWAVEAPERTFVARRGADGQWVRIGYAQMLARAKAVGQALLDRGCSVERPVAILAENSLEHLTLAMGAMWAGVPYAPVSPAYALLSEDLQKLRHILGVITPGLVFATGPAYERAISRVVGADVAVVLAQGRLESRASEVFEDLLKVQPGPTLDAAHRATGPDTIAKFLFTSGSTKQPKGVVNTHRMICANQQMLRQTMMFLADRQPDGGGPVLVDWLPWNHTFGGNHNVGLVLYNGGTLYIDDGKPTPGGIAETLRNLREIAPTVYFNVPKGFEEIARAMETDHALRASLFSRCQAFMFAGAGLSQAVWDQLDAHGEAAVGERLQILTGLGMTETAPSCTFAVGPQVRSGHIGLPCPGVEVKLVQDASTGGKTEVRFKGPNVMPGYWRNPEQTAEAFDEEGFYKTGDAVAWVDPADPQKGLRFDGRIAEDFKLATGTFVSVGPLRARIILAGDPCVQDAVIAGINRDEIGALIIPRPDDCRKLAGLPPGTPMPEVLHHPKLRAFFQAMLDRLQAEATGSATRVARAHVLAEPPSIDKGEVTDKGSINQRAVLASRAALVEALYAGREADPFVYLPSAR